MTHPIEDQVAILRCYGQAAEEYGDTNVMAFSAKVQTMMGMSVSRKIQALCYLFDNLLATNAKLTTLAEQLQATIHDEDPITHQVTKEDAFAALQMAITAAIAKMNEDN